MQKYTGPWGCLRAEHTYFSIKFEKRVYLFAHELPPRPFFQIYMNILFYVDLRWIRFGATPEPLQSCAAAESSLWLKLGLVMAQVGRGWGISSPSTKRAISCRPEPTHALLVTCSSFLWLVFAIKVIKQQAILLQAGSGWTLDSLSLNSRLAQILNGYLNTKGPNPVESELTLPMRRTLFKVWRSHRGCTGDHIR